MTSEANRKKMPPRNAKREAEIIKKHEEETEPDWTKKCLICGQSPIVPITGMCGPCTFGEADTREPERRARRGREKEIMIYIFDIDGTIANLEHRLHFIQQKPADWPAFFAACPDDEPIADMVYLARLISRAGHAVIYVSGRSDECRQATMDWLKKHDLPAPARKVYMRKAGDHREDSIVKSELLDELTSDWPPSHHHIIGVFEDRQQVVDMYRAKGLRVFQVAKGDF